MRVLLDTGVAIIWSMDRDALRPEVHELLISDSAVLLLSAVSPWEVAIKWRTGKLGLSLHPRDWMSRLVRELGTESLPITAPHVLGVADLPDHHRDPFDRLLVAQSRTEGVPIVTTDPIFTGYDVEVIAAR